MKASVHWPREEGCHPSTVPSPCWGPRGSLSVVGVAGTPGMPSLAGPSSPGETTFRGHREQSEQGERFAKKSSSQGRSMEQAGSPSSSLLPNELRR